MYKSSAGRCSSGWPTNDPFEFTWKPRVGGMWPAIGLAARVLLKPSPDDQIISVFHPFNLEQCSATRKAHGSVTRSTQINDYLSRAGPF
jgi:hypothetical protein